MIVFDSSVWIDFLNGNATPEVGRVSALLGTEPLLVGNVFLLEVLQGVRSETDAKRVEAARLRARLERAGVTAFKDDPHIREGDQWLDKLQVALNRYFGPHDETERLPIVPVLLGETKAETLDALACFFDIRPGNPAVRWLEINGNSGSGKRG